MYQKSFLARVLGSNYKKLSGYDIIHEIQNALEARGTELGPFQREVLRDAWSGEYGRLPFEAFVWNKAEKESVSVLWRLSALPLGLWIVLLIAFIPFKWVLTGSANYHGKKVGKFTASWIDKVCG